MTAELDTHLPAQRSAVLPRWPRRVRADAGTTPARLRGLLAALILATLAVCVTGVETVADLRSTTATATDRTSKTVIDAALVSLVLADADRVAVRSLLPSTAGGRRTTSGPGSLYQEDIKSVEQALERAHATGVGVDVDGDGDLDDPVQMINDQMIVYVGDVAQAQAYAAAAPAADPPDRVDLSVVYLSYAANQLRSPTGVLANVEKFRLANRSRLPRDGWGPWPLLGLHLAAGAILLGLLLAAQLLVRRRFHRRLSLELAGVAAIVVLTCGWTTAQSLTTSRAVGDGARETDRITCLSQARTLAALAARDYRYDVHQDLAESTARPPQEGVCALAIPTQEERPTIAQAAGLLDDGAGTARELGTFLLAPPAEAGDHDAAYLHLDRSLRTLQDSHVRPLRRAWDDARPVRGLEWVLVLCATVIVTLIVVAFAPRLREYRRSS